MLYRLDDGRVRPATANITLEKLYNVCLARISVRLQQSNAAHDHSRSAVGALKRASVEKILLHRMQLAFSLKTFNRGDGFCRSGAQGYLTRAPRRSPEQHRAGAALTFSAA